MRRRRRREESCEGTKNTELENCLQLVDIILYTVHDIYIYIYQVFLDGANFRIICSHA